MNHLSLLLSLSCLAITTICSAQDIHGYSIFTLPSSNYQTGDIVAIYSKPKKETVFVRPTFEQKLLTEAEGASLSGQTAREIKARLQAKVEAKVAEGVISGEKAATLTYELANVRTISAPLLSLKSQLQTYLAAHPEEKAELVQLNKRRLFGLLPPKARTDVLTTVLVADMIISDTSKSGGEVSISASQFAAALGVTANKTSSGKVMAKNLIVGYQTNPDVMAILFK